MKQLTAWILGMAIAGTSAAQAPVKLKKDKVYINDQPVCIINKKKNGFLMASTFELRGLDDKTVGILDERNMVSPSKSIYTWYLLRFPGLQDSVEMETKALAAFDKGGLFPKNDEALAGLVAKYGLFENGVFNAEGFARFKKDYPTSVRAAYVAKAEREQTCITALTGRPKSDSLKVDAVTVSLVKVDTAGKNVHAVYSLRQGALVLGTITADGLLKSFRSESAEYDFSSGIMNLDGEEPMDYEVLNPDGCTIARYTGAQKFLGTWKDRASHQFRTIRKFGPEKLNTRIEYLQAMGKLLVSYRYL